MAPPTNKASTSASTSPQDSAPSSTHTASTTTTLPLLSPSAAQLAIHACQRHAAAMGIPMNIAVVDATLHLLAFHRMTGAKLTSIGLAIDKAFTAAGHRAPTSAYREAVWPGGPAYGINGSNGGRFCVIAGGVPVLDGMGRVLGAVGCSTGLPAQDEEVARAGVEAVRREMRMEGEGEGRGGGGTAKL